MDADHCCCLHHYYWMVVNFLNLNHYPVAVQCKSAQAESFLPADSDLHGQVEPLADCGLEYCLAELHIVQLFHVIE